MSLTYTSRYASGRVESRSSRTCKARRSPTSNSPNHGHLQLWSCQRFALWISDTSLLPERLGRLNTQRASRRCRARKHTHDRHDDRRDHRRGDEIRGQAVGAPRKKQDETVAGNDPATELTAGAGENAAEHVPTSGA